MPCLVGKVVPLEYLLGDLANEETFSCILYIFEVVNCFSKQIS